jgi:hypothetical protein
MSFLGWNRFSGRDRRSSPKAVENDPRALALSKRIAPARATLQRSQLECSRSIDVFFRRDRCVSGRARQAACRIQLESQTGKKLTGCQSFARAAISTGITDIGKRSSNIPYIGDGATIRRSFVRRRGDRLIGHAPVRTQLGWCAKEGVPRAIITHCGSEIVAGDERSLRKTIAVIARDLGIEAQIAHDRMELALRKK